MSALTIRRAASLILSCCIAACGGGGGDGGAPAVTLSAISIAPATVTLTPGGQRQLAATGLYSDASSRDVTTFSVWGTSSTAVATVSSTGLATGGTAGGTATVTATIGAVSGSASVTLDPPIVGSITVPRTGQTTCYDDFGDYVNCTGTGQDGELQRGAAWPVPRFVDNADGTVTDALTGLQWLQNANCKGTNYPNPTGTVYWEDALDFVATINTGRAPLCAAGHSDWRLPSINELETLAGSSQDITGVMPGSPFTGVSAIGGSGYWSSTFRWWASPSGYLETSTMSALVWPVRDDPAVTAPPARVARTGQVSCYRDDGSGQTIPCAGTGQDGDLRSGVPWPVPRFVAKGDGTVVDKLTGLIWLQNANCFGAQYWLPALAAAQGLASGACGLSDHSAAGDWRLPNRKELRTLVDFSRSNPAIPAGSPFTNVASAYYQTSTTCQPGVQTPGAVKIYLGNGRTGCDYKRIINGITPQPAYVWPVRGGQ